VCALGPVLQKKRREQKLVEKQIISLLRALIVSFLFL
jgi:hypothetical protein